mgnify:FL=1
MDYTQFLPPLWGLFGAGLQWLRQFPKVKDWQLALATITLCSAVYGVSHIFTADWRFEVLTAPVTIAGYVLATAGGTFAAAKAAHSWGAIPKTNSAH